MNMEKKIEVFEASGTHYEVGYAMGKRFKDKIHKMRDIWSHYKANVEFIEDEGKKILSDYMSVAEEAYPQYVEEIRGIADGAEMTESQVFAINAWCELFRNPKRDKMFATPAEHCTDIFISNEEYMVHAHNEDAFLGCQDLGYILTAHIKDEKPRGKFWAAEERFTAYCWPGLLPGYCFGFNSHGVTHAINTLTPHSLLENKTPVAFLTRATLAAKSFDEVERIFRDEGHGIALGISLNTCSLIEDAKKFCNFEVLANPDETKSIVKRTCVGNGKDCDVTSPYFHANRYEHIDGIEGLSKLGGSTLNRHKLYLEFPPAKSLQDVLTIIGYEGPTGIRQDDTIYNNYTAATALFDFNKGTLSVYSSNPVKDKPEHVFVLPTPRG